MNNISSNNFPDAHKHDPANEFDEYWPEADLPYNVWPFAYRAFEDREIQACLGEHCSVAVALGKNKDRSLEAKVDVLFKASNKEIGSAEIRKHNVIRIDDKYLYDGLVIASKILGNMLSVLVEKDLSQANNV